jgi:hypothetical protein
MRREEREGGDSKPFCGSGSPAVAGEPEGKDPGCEETTAANADPQTVGSVASVAEDVPPLPDAKPAPPAEAAAETPGAKAAKAKSTRSAKRAFKRELARLRRLFDD